MVFFARCLFSSSARPALAPAACALRRCWARRGSAPLPLARPATATTTRRTRRLWQLDGNSGGPSSHPEASSGDLASIARVSKSRGLPSDAWEQFACWGMHVGATQTRSRRCLWRCIWRVGFFGSQQQVFVRPLRLTNWRGRRNGANRELRRLVRALGLALPLVKSSDAEGDNLFVAIQDDGALPLAEPGAGGARSRALARVVRNLSFAKQRWDSTAGPVAKMAPARERAVTLLKKEDGH